MDHVVDDLAVRLDVEDRTSLRRYYQRLEGGVLDPHPVDERVWPALGDALAPSVRSLIRPLVTRRGGSAMAYYRRTSPDLRARAHAIAGPRAGPRRRGSAGAGEQEALDRLFLGDA